MRCFLLKKKCCEKENVISKRMYWKSNWEVPQLCEASGWRVTAKELNIIFWADLQNFRLIKIISISKCSPKSNNRIKPNSQNSRRINNAPTSWRSGMTRSLSRLNSHLLTTLTHTLTPTNNFNTHTSAIDITINSGLSGPKIQLWKKENVLI